MTALRPALARRRDDLVVIHLAKSEGAPESQIAEAVAQLAYERPAPETLAAMRAIETSFVEGEGLRLHIHGRPDKRMHPTAPRKFFFKDRPQSTAYITTTAASTMLVLERGGGSLRYRRVATEG